MPEETDLVKAVKALGAKGKLYRKWWNYYDGDQPLVYSAEKLREIFKGCDAHFTQNWCAVVVDSCLDRINLQHFDVADDRGLTKRLNDMWRATEMQLDSDDAHAAALVTGESFVIAGRNDEGEIESYYNAPELCHVEYDTDMPRRKAFAAKWWIDQGGRFRLTLYYPDRFEEYESATKADTTIAPEPKSFKWMDTRTNPYGEIPVFHLRRMRRRLRGEIQNVFTIQDAINKLIADMMVAAEFGAFRQRWVISNADIANLKNGPNMVWDIPAGDKESHPTTVGEFQQSQLAPFLEAIDRLAYSIAIITRTPKHYLFGQGGTPSGEALVAMEAPLNKRASSYIERFEPVWRDLARFLLKLETKEVDAMAITPHFDEPETIQPLTQANIRVLGRNAGLPLKTLLRDEGWTSDELEDLNKDLEEDDEREARRQARRLDLAETAFSRGGNLPGDV
jgi:hypothetical protein